MKRRFAGSLPRLRGSPFIVLLLVSVIILVLIIAVPQFREWLSMATGIPALAQIFGGVFFSLIIAYFTWRTVRSSERNVELSREGQVTERFTKAIEQLGDTTNLAKRLGGIYALERIARDSPRDYWTIMEVLTAYVRENAPRKEGQGQLQPAHPAADIHAILTVLGRRALRYGEGEENRLDLQKTDLRGANLVGAQLEGVIFKDAQLQEANFRRAQLQRAILSDAQLQGAIFKGAELQGANFVGAQLQGAYLWEIDLSGVDLRGAELEGACVSKAQLQRAVIDTKTQLRIQRPGYLNSPPENESS